MAVAKPRNVKPRAKMTKITKNNKKPDTKLLIIAQEIKLAKILAGNNKTLRDRTLKRLKKWFDARETQMPFTEDDFMRIWKGLFYYMWMSDKPLVQEECAVNIAKLVDFKEDETSLLFFKCFLQTMIDEWFGIDYLRLDKFLMLVRRVLRQSFNVLLKAEWAISLIKIYQEVLSSTILKIETTVPLSLSMHVTEIYLEELAKVSKGNVSEETVLELLRPFALQLAHSVDVRQSNHIKSHIFRYLMQQSDSGIEYQERFNAWKLLGFPGGTIDALDKIEVDNVDEPTEEEMEDSPLDVRAGKVHVVLKQLKFDPIKIAEMLDEIKYKPSTSTKSRRALTSIADQFRQLANGNYPLGLKKIYFKPKDDGYKTNLKSSLKRLEYFEKNLMGDSKKAKSARGKKNKIEEIVTRELKKYKNLVPEKKSAKTLEEFVSRSEGGIMNPALVKNTFKKPIPVVETKKKTLSKVIKKRKIKTDDTEDSEKRFKRNSGIWEVDDLDKSQIIQSKTTLGWATEELKTKKKPKKSAKEQHKETTEIKIKISSTKNKRITPKTISPLTPVSSDDTPAQSTPKKGVKSLLTTPQNSMVKNPFSTPPSSTKKVKIALNLNRSQDTKEYRASLVSSPSIPYDASRKPNKSLLKARPSLPSSINPFYRH